VCFTWCTSSGYEFPRAQFCPLTLLLPKAETAHYIPLHKNIFPFSADIDIDTGGFGGEIRMLGEVGLLVLSFHSMIGDTAIHKLTVNADAHN